MATPPDAAVSDTLSDIMDGSMAARLQSAKTNNYNDLTTIMKYTSDPDPRVRQLANQALSENGAARAALQEAIGKYSMIVGWVETAYRSLGRTDYPPQLSGMGSLGAVGVDDVFYAMVAIVGATVVIAGIYALIAAWNAFQGRTDSSRGYMDQFSGVLDSAGRALTSAAQAATEGSSALWSIGILAVLGTAAYFAWPKAKRYFGR